MNDSCLKGAAKALLLAALMAAPASATSYVMMRDSALADGAPVIVEGSVITVAPSPASGKPATDYIVLVERLLKGTVSGSAVVVRVPGGVGPDGIGFAIFGAPSFRDGDRALFFLSPSSDGTYRIQHLMLGAFHASTQRGVEMALRDLSEAVRVGPDAYSEADRPRHFGRFADWLADRARGVVRGSDYFMRSSEVSLRSAGQRFTLIREAGKRMRWFEFDSGDSVEWFLHRDGYDGRGGGKKQFGAGIDAWNDDPKTLIQYTYSGKTSASSGFSDFDGINAILFEDPNNDVGESFSCALGGVLAIGGPWFDTEVRQQWNGRSYIQIQGADIITARGTSCYFDQHPERREEVWAHELGHTLGFGHSCGGDDAPSCTQPALTDALMRAFAHDDGRGASLRDDDRAAANRLYGDGRGGGGGGGGDTSSSLDAPSDLRANRRSASEVRLRWQDNSAEESEFVIFRQFDGGGFHNFASAPTDATQWVLSGLAPGTYDFRVRAKGSGARSEFSNTVTISLP